MVSGVEAGRLVQVHAKESDLTLRVLGSTGGLGRRGRTTAEDPEVAVAQRAAPAPQLPGIGTNVICPQEPSVWHAAMDTHPDASDARRARRAILAQQALLALLATLTVRPWVPPVPLGGKGMRRRERERE